MQSEYSNNPASENQPQGEPKPSGTPKSILPRLEIMIIGVFFISFVFWAVARCNRTRAEYAEMEYQEKVQDSLEKEMTAEIAKPVTPKEETPEVAQPVFEVPDQPITPLYVTLENLNVRDKPSLSGKIVGRLKLFDEVTFLNEVTDFRQEIKLGEISAYEPWVKVKTDEGKEGWVYGAGVHYFKTKLDIEKPSVPNSN